MEKKRCTKSTQEIMNEETQMETKTKGSGPTTQRWRRHLLLHDTAEHAKMYFDVGLSISATAKPPVNRFGLSRRL